MIVKIVIRDSDLDAPATNMKISATIAKTVSMILSSELLSIFYALLKSPLNDTYSLAGLDCRQCASQENFELFTRETSVREK